MNLTFVEYFSRSCFLVLFCSIENLHCCGLRQEGYWFDQDQRCSFEPSSTWYPQVEGVRAHLCFGWGQVRQRKLSFILQLSALIPLTALLLFHIICYLDNVLQVDIRVRVKGGGSTSQIYAIRQAIAKGIVAYYQKCKFHRCLRVAFLSFAVFWPRCLVYADAFHRCRWGLQETVEGDLGSIRQNLARRRSSQMRAQEVRWSWCSCPLPEVLPLSDWLASCTIVQL